MGKGARTQTALVPSSSIWIYSGGKWEPLEVFKLRNEMIKIGLEDVIWQLMWRQVV